MIKRGKTKRPFKGIIYGVEGVGKTTLAAQMPNPIFLCAEDGVSKIDCAKWVFEEVNGVDRVQPKNHTEFFSALTTLTHNKDGFKTLVVDGVDSIDRMIADFLCFKYKWKSLQDPGWAKGESAAMNLWREIVAQFDEAVMRGMNVVLVGHAAVGNVTNTEGANYKKYRLAVTKTEKVDGDVDGFLRGWADFYVFARFEPMLKTDEKRTYGVGIQGARVLHLQATDSYEAKVRGEGAVPPRIPLSWPDLEKIIEQIDINPAEVRAEIAEYLEQLPADKIEATKKWLENPALSARDLTQGLDRIKASIIIKAA